MKFEKEASKLYSKLDKEEVEGKIKYFRKREVYPVLNEDGSINWFNFLTGGSYKRLIWTIIILTIVILFFLEYTINLKSFGEYIKAINDLGFADEVKNYLNGTRINYSQLNFSNLT